MAAAYLKGYKGGIILFAVLLLSLFLIYGLYGLPWGPAVYTSAVILMLGLVFAISDFHRYSKRTKLVWNLCRQKVFCLEELLPPGDLLEQSYQEALYLSESRLRGLEGQTERDAAAAGRYYMMWSHQIKTPIAAMRLLLQEEGTNLGPLDQELFKIEQYVDMVLQYQRLKLDTNDLLIREYDLNFLVKQAVKKVSTLFIHKKIGVDVKTCNQTVITDEKWLVFVLEQLLTNAVKYTQQGSIFIFQTDDRTGLVIKDTGIGIRPEDLPRIFDWGYTGYNGRADKQSTGIGLSLCKRAMTLLGHSVSVESEVGRGTSVILDLSRNQFDIE